MRSELRRNLRCSRRGGSQLGSDCLLGNGSLLQSQAFELVKAGVAPLEAPLGGHRRVNVLWISSGSQPVMPFSQFSSMSPRRASAAQT